MRQQTRTYLLAHGANPDAMSEEDFMSVMVALNDGYIGNKAVLNVLGALTCGVFNYIRSKNAPAYKLRGILGIAYDYLYRPLTDEEKRQQANDQLIAFMQMAPR